MSDGDALLRAILLNPAEDTPRLMYADWLEDVSGGNDAAHAEFIRVQCEFHTWRPSALCVHNSKPHYRFKPSKRCGISTDNPEHNCACRFELLRVRERNLWADQVRAAHDADGRLWGLPVERVTVPSKNAPRTYSEETYVVERGFVAHVFAPLAVFMSHAEALFRAHPIEDVTLTDRFPEVNEGTQTARWFCSDSPHHLQFPDRLPRGLYDIAKTEATCSFSFDGFDPNANFAAGFAIPALSRACVAYGRVLAGLSALPAPVAVS